MFQEDSPTKHSVLHVGALFTAALAVLALMVTVPLQTRSAPSATPSLEAPAHAWSPQGLAAK